ncbi:MAG: LrgB family protein [Kurthia sp.]|nr:LrgB family protein [Candidatus Kurthia equi]
MLAMISYAVLTIGIFFFMTWLYKRTGISFLFPILTSTIVLLIILATANIPYEKYMEGGKMINFFLGPAVVAMAYPLYSQWSVIMRYKKTILLSVIIAMFAGMVSVLLLGLLFGLNEEILRSFLPKSITSPVAIQISEAIQGIPQMTVLFVIVAGITGAIGGPTIYKVLKINSPVSRGVAMGSAAHGIGVSKLNEYGELTLSIGSVAMTLSALLGSFLCPIIVYLIF